MYQIVKLAPAKVGEIKKWVFIFRYHNDIYIDIEYLRLFVHITNLFSHFYIFR